KRALTITANPEQGSAKLYYRGTETERAAEIDCVPDLAIIASRLGGDSPPGEQRLNLSYGDIVGLLERLADKGLIVSGDGREKANFVLQSLPGSDDPILSAPMIPDQRPSSDTPTIENAPSIDAPSPDLPPANPLAPS